MRILFWYCEKFAWQPAMKTLDTAPEAEKGDYQNVLVAFIHVEPKDVLEGSSAEKKLLKNIKWLSKKWDNKKIILHSFTHLGEEKADPDDALELLNRVGIRLNNVDFEVIQTPYGYFLDLSMQAKGHPLARIYKEF
ncbi:MAG: threonyl-tRNA synthetase editing domain-containing protein [gamma proteobacterium symbiont of Bathyaustriella thionipta]|nr:threonyl-tRNA synthetase editing domain-containing protein [gamma proteobacterium symbiont of Bathyaustriella thionipta]MCU7951540.1 threonyl-tRNA synthetase editing domain-containing protein [gamma proteobacterium symbiont of Bathyaustriella thionipta]MCU7958185.1 threonyl-tRNA synthetase editing domain-containing protein [gamma proteobacterium symbiont of Bathyaustriella thionipta]MCU7965852.1 threonyl-tRNA synthetase editing domain-containing protein [gamma proteobacterium symbiont of Bath